MQGRVHLELQDFGLLSILVSVTAVSRCEVLVKTYADEPLLGLRSSITRVSTGKAQGGTRIE